MVQRTQLLAEAMVPIAVKVLLDPPQFDFVKSGAGDTGEIVLASDLTLSQDYVRLAERAHVVGFTEEEDPRSERGVPHRIGAHIAYQFDPVDGSGDRRFGQDQPGTAAAEGYTSLASIIENGEVTAGICIRPSNYHRQVWIFAPHGIELFSISPDFQRLERRPFTREVPDTGNLIRVNRRPAYPQTNFPDDVLELASELSRGAFRYIWQDAGGAGDCFCRLVEGDLDIVVSGRRTDWKSWDTDPFSLGIKHLAGKMTRYDERPLDKVATRDLDLWHTGGVISSIGCADAHGHFCEALRIYEERSGMRDGRPLIYDPRRTNIE
jgi:hypothetical protein